MTAAVPRTRLGEPADVGRWRQLAVISVAELLALAPWFGASAVAPNLVESWALGGLDLPILTVAVQLGFVGGALLLALTGARVYGPISVAMAAGARRARGRMATSGALAAGAPAGGDLVRGLADRGRSLASDSRDAVGRLTVGRSLGSRWRNDAIQGVVRFVTRSLRGDSKVCGPERSGGRNLCCHGRGRLVAL